MLAHAAAMATRAAVETSDQPTAGCGAPSAGRPQRRRRRGTAGRRAGCPRRSPPPACRCPSTSARPRRGTAPSLTALTTIATPANRRRGPGAAPGRRSRRRRRRTGQRHDQRPHHVELLLHRQPPHVLERARRARTARSRRSAREQVPVGDVEHRGEAVGPDLARWFEGRRTPGRTPRRRRSARPAPAAAVGPADPRTDAGRCGPAPRRSASSSELIRKPESTKNRSTPR